MLRRTILRTAPLILAAATLLAACSDQLPPGAVARGPFGPRLTVTPTNPFSEIDGGESYACGLTGSGQAYCWGRNAFAQLGDSSFANRSVPVAVKQGSLSFLHISAGQFHTCAIVNSGQAYCWGANSDGRIGDSTAANNRRIPVAVHQQSLAFTAISAGIAHTCALNVSGQAYCWGDNSYGQLGDNSTAYRRTPVAVQQPAGVTFYQIAAGNVHTCALALGGQAYCWGYGGEGQLGYGFTIGDSIPQTVTQPGGVSFTSVYTMYNHTCALTSGGAAYCWGANGMAQLGDSTTTTQYTPVAVRMPSGVTFNDMALGSLYSCGISGSAQAYCWGAGTLGQLGDGNSTSSFLPVAVSQPAGVGFYLIRGQASSVCATDAVQQTWCWGSNTYGQLGDNSTTNRSTPVAVVH